MKSEDREMCDLSEETATEHLLDARGPSKHAVCRLPEPSPATQEVGSGVPSPR